MSYENYIKNKDKVQWLQDNYVDHAKNHNLFRERIITETLFDVEFTAHCRCCEAVYKMTGQEYVNHNMTCKCGSWRLEMYETTLL